MQFVLRLLSENPSATIPFNYQYLLTGALYRLLGDADAAYAQFLHEHGYQTARKTFRLFTFSDLRMHGYEVRPREGCFVLTSPVIDWTLSFYVDRAAEAFITGLFQNQRLTLANRQHRTDLVVERVEMVPVSLTGNAVELRTLSPMVVAEKDMTNMDQYLHPADELFGPLLLQNMIDKYRSANPETDVPGVDSPSVADFTYQLLTPPGKVRSRLVTIKEGTRDETKVRGWYGFDFALTGPTDVLEVGMLAGVGRYNAEGFGCVRLL